MASVETKELHPDEKLAIGDLGGTVLKLGAALGVVGLVVAAVMGQMTGWSRFFYSYLVSFSFYLSIALGAMFFVLLQHQVRAAWSVTVRRLAEILTQTFPLLAALFLVIAIPLLMGYEGIYSWVSSDDHLVKAKQGWLNVPFFMIRAVIYFAVWIFITRYFFKKSLQQDESGDPAISEKLRRAAGPSIIAYAFTTCYGSFDFLMSLHPAWYSTIFGIYFFAGCAISLMASLVLISRGLQGSGRLVHSINVEHYHDLGKLLFGFIFFWGYIAFSQFMLIWYADLPEETAWYHPRMTTSWKVLSLILLFGHLFFPFVSLLSRETKRRLRLLTFFCAWMLAMHYLDLYWIVMPEYSPAGFEATVTNIVMDVANFVGIGGLFLAWAARVAQRVVLIPVKEPRLGISLAFENF
jgi:hypothetical protein